MSAQRTKLRKTPSNRAERKPLRIEARPLTPDNWPDFEKLFGPRGACAGCWCMWWRRTHAEFEKSKGGGNKRAMKRIVASGETAGLIGYLRGEPVAWCSLAPREAYVRLTGSRVLQPVDDTPVWSVVCFFVARAHRRSGIGVAMLKEAVRYAAKQKAKVVEGYPVEPIKDTMPDAFAWTGLAEQFRRAGFTEVARRSATRPIMRFVARKGNSR
jgi:GNAT superfamily N-acetyltransferase